MFELDDFDFSRESEKNGSVEDLKIWGQGP